MGESPISLVAQKLDILLQDFLARAASGAILGSQSLLSPHRRFALHQKAWRISNDFEAGVT